MVGSSWIEGFEPTQRQLLGSGPFFVSADRGGMVGRARGGRGSGRAALLTGLLVQPFLDIARAVSDGPSDLYKLGARAHVSHVGEDGRRFRESPAQLPSVHDFAGHRHSIH